MSHSQELQSATTDELRQSEMQITEDIAGFSGPCPSCGGREFATFQPAAFRVPIYACRNCRLHITRQPEVADGAEPDQVYEASYHTDYEKNAEKKTRTSSYRLCVVENAIEPGRLLDIGCSVGCFLRAAVARGWDAHGVDPSKYCVESCITHGLHARIGDMRHLDFPDESFDLINLRHVLEHDWELSDCVREMKRVLKTGGLLLVEVPSVDCWQVRLRGARYAKFWSPAHYHYYWFSRRALQNVMSQAGFEHVPLPLYGKMMSCGGFSDTLGFLLWRTHKLMRHWLYLSPLQVQAWHKT